MNILELNNRHLLLLPTMSNLRKLSFINSHHKTVITIKIITIPPITITILIQYTMIMILVVMLVSISD